MGEEAPDGLDERKKRRAARTKKKKLTKIEKRGKMKVRTFYF
jgi:hypothetical protein